MLRKTFPSDHSWKLLESQRHTSLLLSLILRSSRARWLLCSKEWVFAAVLSSRSFIVLIVIMSWWFCGTIRWSTKDETRHGKCEYNHAPKNDMCVQTKGNSCKEDIIAFDQVIVKMDGLLNPYHQQNFHKVDEWANQLVSVVFDLWLEKRLGNYFAWEALLVNHKYNDGAKLLQEKELISPINVKLEII